MLSEGSILLGTIVGACLVGVLVGWTGVVYWSARRRWRRLDPLLFGLLFQCCLRQGAVAARSGLRLFRPAPEVSCSMVLWSGTALHALQAATLAALSLSAPLSRRRPALFTRSHLGYHLVSTALLSSCVGLAAVLSRPDACDPDDSDPRYTLFSLAFHTALLSLSLIGLFLNCCSPPTPPHSSSSSPGLPSGSTSDLSSSSDVSRHSSSSDHPLRARHYLVAELLMRAKLGETDPTYMSTTSSTNSRACLAKTKPPEFVPPVTAIAVVLIGLAANHIPVLVLGLSEEVWGGVWRVDEVPEWGAILEGLLLPLVLALCDRAFLDRVASVYTRSHPYDLPRPTQGLYGKFRRFGGSMMQSQPDGVHQPGHHRFPITNGSLFTTLEGRGCLMRQHNYRRVPPPVALPVGVPGNHHHHNYQQQHQNQKRSPDMDSNSRGGGGVSSVDQLKAFLGVEDPDEPVLLYATLSSLRSACSATTAANDDFEYFHQDPPAQQQQSQRMLHHQQPHVHQQQQVAREMVSNMQSSQVVDKERQREEMGGYNTDEEGVEGGRGGFAVGRKKRRWRRSLPGRPHPREQSPSSIGRLAPVLSVDSLAAVLSKPGVSYLDTGDICTHKCDSVPDFKRIFLTDYL